MSPSRRVSYSGHPPTQRFPALPRRDPAPANARWQAPEIRIDPAGMRVWSGAYGLRALGYRAGEATARTPVARLSALQRARGHELRSGGGIAAYVTHQSKVMPIKPDDDPRLDRWRERGKALFSTRVGQPNPSCAHCPTVWQAGPRLGAHPRGASYGVSPIPPRMGDDRLARASLRQLLLQRSLRAVRGGVRSLGIPRVFLEIARSRSCS